MDRGATAAATLEDLQQSRIERLGAPIVENQKIDTPERKQQTLMAAVGDGESRHALIKHGTTDAARPSAEASRLSPTI